MHRYRTRRLAVALSTLIIVGVISFGIHMFDSTAAPDVEKTRPSKQTTMAVKDSETIAVDQEPTSAVAALETLQVKGRAPKTDYERSHFGNGWQSVEGCDMRNRILARDLTETALAENSFCLVQSGTLADPYTGTIIQFTRGNTTSSRVQIDHVVALSDAWQKGAQLLSPDQRQQLANDPLELLAVDGPTNMKKGDGDAATWLPPNKAFRCQYIARQIAVKIKYTLWVTQAEKNAMKNVLTTCPSQILPQP